MNEEDSSCCVPACMRFQSPPFLSFLVLFSGFNGKQRIAQLFRLVSLNDDVAETKWVIRRSCSDQFLPVTSFFGDRFRRHCRCSVSVEMHRANRVSDLGFCAGLTFSS